MEDEFILLPARRLHVPMESDGTALRVLMSMRGARSTRPPLIMEFPGSPPIEVILIESMDPLLTRIG